MSDRHDAGFRRVTRLADARETLREGVAAHGRTERVPVADADGRAVAADLAARRAVPHYRRAAMDGYAVRAADTVGAGDRSPVTLEIATGPVGEGEAARVHTGSELPDGADAVVMVEATETRDRELSVFEAVAETEHVAPVGEDVAAGQHLYDAGHRLRPSDLGLLRSAGHDAVPVFERPRVAVLPTGEELVDDDPDPGEVVETNGLAVSRLVERWGGTASYRDVVTDDREALRAALDADREHDLVVTTGGSSVGERDLVPEVVGELGEVLVHGVALKPGHPVALGTLSGDTPVLMLPGYPVSCLVNAVQFLRPAVAWSGGFDPAPVPTVEAELAGKVRSEPGRRTFARVEVECEGDRRLARPTRAGGAGVLSSVALADGWVEVPEGREGLPADETVTVQDWEPQR
jgi:molybdopterin molybdotransferase